VTNLSLWLSETCHGLIFQNRSLEEPFIRTDGLKEFFEAFLAPDADSKLESEPYELDDYPDYYCSDNVPENFAQRTVCRLLYVVIEGNVGENGMLKEIWNRFFASGPICGAIIAWLRSEDPPLFLDIIPHLHSFTEASIEGVRERFLQLGIVETLGGYEDRIELWHQRIGSFPPKMRNREVGELLEFLYGTDP